MNHYPAWKYLLLVAVISIACIYATPNLYGEDPAVQVSSASDVLTPSFTTSLERTLEQNGLSASSIDADQSRVLMRFASGEEQLKARDALTASLDKDDYTVALNLAPATPSWLRDLNANPMYLGLDLRGGIHFLMQVDMKGAIQGVMESYASDIRTNLREDKIRNRGTRAEEDKLRIRFTALDKREAALSKLKPLYKDLEFSETEDDKGFHLLVALRPEAVVAEKKLALTQNITALRNRVNALGVSEPVIQQQGLDRIVVQLPGVQDSAKAREILGSTATLEYRMQHGTYQEGISAADSGRIPVGAKLFQRRDGYPVLLSSSVIVTGENIQNAAVSYDQNNQPAVSITLDSKGADKMLKNTKENTKKPMAVVFKEIKFDTKMVNGKKERVSRVTEKVISIATINGIFGKNFQTTGLSKTEASRLAILLRAGALKAPMEIVEERTVGPSLGADNIAKGQKSVIIGLIAVLVFMAIYYKAFGLIANVALAANLVMIFAVMSMLQATLTLPGIAGIVLTVGMAVDANVLIFERIKEELRAGSKIQEAIHEGYNKAFSTIADANITTFIAAALLFSFGTGPIKGFAVTLSIGILTSMFTAIMGTRALVNLFYGGKRLKSIAISWGQGMKATAFKFMQGRFIAMVISGVLVAGSIGSLSTNGLVLGIDFTGGYLIEVGYKEAAELPPIRAALDAGGYDDAVVQHFGTAKDVMVRIQPREGLESSAVSDAVMDLLRTQNPEVDLRRIEFVGPQIGEELREDGGMAMLFALMAIVIYVAFRFQLKFSIGAVTALVHDVIITMGVFSITAIEFDLTVLAALLAVIGYSLNDTIVVFDRIRENFRKMRRGESIDVLNSSINQTLSRTLMTSVTTMIVLIALYTLGGEVIHSFAFALIIGVIVGTYSSIFVASTGLLMMKISKDDLVESEEKRDELDAIP